MTRFAQLAVLAVAVLVAAGGPTMPVAGGDRAEVVVLLDSPPLALAPGSGGRIADEQQAFRSELATRVPGAEIGWRYRLVANGFSLALPSSEVERLRALPGVRDVLPAGSYAPQLTSSPQQIGAPALWGQALDTAGQGVKVGIIDSGIDPTHPFFDPAGYVMPAGFPRGQQRFTTAKVIVARVFAPKGATAASTRVAYSDDDSSHGTHVAGIAAGNADTNADGRRVSGVAPRAYLGNYKVFVETSTGLSPNANSPAIVAAIEAAVADGMNVINFSGGEPEIEPSRDIVAIALDAAAAAGVVPVVAAGNDYNDLGAGSVSSPANSARAIAVGAVAIGGSPTTRTHAEFSSVGPTTISHRLKPDVAAPGVDVLSSISGGGWAEFSGTSMAAPHVAGAAALLRQRHPVVVGRSAQVGARPVRNRLDPEPVSRRRPALPGRRRRRARTRRSAARLRAAHSALVRLARTRADRDGHHPPRRRGRRSRHLGGRPIVRGTPAGLRFTAPATVVVPGQLQVVVTVPRGARAGDLDAYVELRRGADVRRIPVWARVTPASLARHTAGLLARPGVYRSTTAGRPSVVSRYRYPETPRGIGVTTTLNGPERVFRFRIAKRVANAGVVITQLGRGSAVEPRIVAGRRREPADRLCRAPGEPQPVHGRVPRAAGCCGRALPRARRVRGRVRQRDARGRRCVHLPLLGRRRDAPDRSPADEKRARRPAAARVCRGRGCRHLPAVHPRFRRRLVEDGRATRDADRDPDGRLEPRLTSPTRSRLRLPGVEEHRERRAHPPEHALDDRDVQIR